jgi:hypothetical protein
VSDERNICFLFLHTVFDVSDDRQNAAPAKKMHHAVKDGLPKFQLQNGVMNVNEPTYKPVGYDIPALKHPNLHKLTQRD